MEAASNQTRQPTACPSNLGRLLIILLLMTLFSSGCVSFRVDRINDGAEVPPPAPELISGKTTLTDVLARYGAPTHIVDMQEAFALVYEKSFYRGGQISIGIPLSDIIKTSFNLEAAGNLTRRDRLTFIFANDGVLREKSFEKGTSQPLWNSFWK